MSFYAKHVFFCCNQRDGGDRPSCNAKGASQMRDYAKSRIKKLGLAGFSFGASLMAKLAEQEKPEWLVLIGVGITRIMAPPVAAGTLVIHGENDDTVPLAAVMDWARPQELPVVVVPGADHFFHRKLHILRALVQGNWR